MFRLILVTSIAIILAIILHEVGHIVVLNKYGRKAKLYFYKKKLIFKAGKPEDYEGLTGKQKLEIYIVGIIVGTIPILLFYWFIWEIFNWVIVGYLMSCLSDWLKIFRLIKFEEDDLDIYQEDKL